MTSHSWPASPAPLASTTATGDRDKVIFYDSLDDLSTKLTRALRPIVAGARTTTKPATTTA